MFRLFFSILNLSLKKRSGYLTKRQICYFYAKKAIQTERRFVGEYNQQELQKGRSLNGLVTFLHFFK